MKKRAFSLVEMLIVISIIGILGAIVIPMLQDHSHKAKEAAAKMMIQSVFSGPRDMIR